MLGMVGTTYIEERGTPLPTLQSARPKILRPDLESPRDLPSRCRVAFSIYAEVGTSSVFIKSCPAVER